MQASIAQASIAGGIGRGTIVERYEMDGSVWDVQRALVAGRQAANRLSIAQSRERDHAWCERELGDVPAAVACSSPVDDLSDAHVGGHGLPTIYADLKRWNDAWTPARHAPGQTMRIPVESLGRDA